MRIAEIAKSATLSYDESGGNGIRPFANGSWIAKNCKEDALPNIAKEMVQKVSELDFSNQLYTRQSADGLLLKINQILADMDELLSLEKDLGAADRFRVRESRLHEVKDQINFVKKILEEGSCVA